MSALSAVLLIYSFQFRSGFFHVGQPGDTAAYLVYPISDIRRRRKFKEVFVRSVQSMEWLWINSRQITLTLLSRKLGQREPSASTSSRLLYCVHSTQYSHLVIS